MKKAEECPKCKYQKQKELLYQNKQPIEPFHIWLKHLYSQKEIISPHFFTFI